MNICVCACVVHAYDSPYGNNAISIRKQEHLKKIVNQNERKNYLETIKTV